MLPTSDKGFLDLSKIHRGKNMNTTLEIEEQKNEAMRLEQLTSEGTQFKQIEREITRICGACNRCVGYPTQRCPAIHALDQLTSPQNWVSLMDKTICIENRYLLAAAIKVHSM